MNRTLYILLIAALAASAVAAPPPLLVEYTWDGAFSHQDEAHRVAVDADGDIVLMGTSYRNSLDKDAVFQRIDADGTLLWSTVLPDCRFATPSAMVLEPDGSLVAVLDVVTESQVGQAALVKISPDGTIVWDRRYGEFGGGWSLPISLSRSATGDWVICAAADTPDADIFLGTFDSDGLPLWSRVIDNGSEEYPRSAAFGTDGSIYFAGNTMPFHTLYGRYSADGDSLWHGQMQAEAMFELATRVLPTADGGAVFSGNPESGWGVHMSLTWKVDADGNVLWTGRHPAPDAIAQPFGFAGHVVTSDGRVVVVGDYGAVGSTFHFQCFDASGNELWTAAPDGPGNYETAQAWTGLPDGRVACAGMTQITSTNFDIQVSVVDPLGAHDWTATWDGPFGLSERAAGMAAGPDGSIAVVGQSYFGDDEGGANFLVLKYGPTTTSVEPGDDAPPAFARPSLNAAPNPFNPRTRVAFEMPRPGRARVEVFDLAGRRVRVLMDRDVTAGNHTVEWYGRNDAGATVAAGAYMLRLTTDDDAVTHRVALVK